MAPLPRSSRALLKRKYLPGLLAEIEEFLKVPLGEEQSVWNPGRNIDLGVRRSGQRHPCLTILALYKKHHPGFSLDASQGNIASPLERRPGSGRAWRIVNREHP